MSNENNIQNFDDFFKEAFNSFEPPAPNGVFEAVQSQLGTAAGSSSVGGAAQTLSNVAQWGIGKIVVGVVAAVTIATTIYIAAKPEANVPNQETTSTVATPNDGTSSSAVTIDNTTAENTQPLADKENGTKNSPLNTGGESNQTPTNTSSQGNNTPSTPDNNNGSSSQANLPTTPKQNNSGGDNGKPSEQQKISVGLYLSNQQVCAGDDVTITIADDLAKFAYKVNFGDGTIKTTKIGKPTQHTYTTKGKYKVIATSLDGNKETSEQWVTVNKPKAAFTSENVEKAMFRFSNTSTESAYYNWFFGDGSEMSNTISPTHTYHSFDAKNYTVKLIAMDAMGCVDSFSSKVSQTYTYNDIKPKIYNVFSPGADGRNDHYVIEIENEAKYHLIIMDRSGNKVFESTDKNNTWDGKNMFTGEDCAEGSYVMVFVYKIKGFDERSQRGLVTLKRE